MRSTAGGGSWKTSNGGKTWLPLFDGGHSAPLFSGAIAVDPTNPLTVYLATGEANNSADSFYGRGVYKSTDAGHTWALLTGANGNNPFIGQAISRSRDNAYRYLPASVNEFPDGEALAERLRRHGLAEVRFHPLTFGIATLYVGRKKPA